MKAFLVKHKNKVMSILSVLSLSMMMSLSAFAADVTPATDYKVVTDAVTSEVSAIVAASIPMISGVFVLGISLMGLFVMMHVGRKAVGAATGSK